MKLCQVEDFILKRWKLISVLYFHYKNIISQQYSAEKMHNFQQKSMRQRNQQYQSLRNSLVKAVPQLINMHMHWPDNKGRYIWFLLISAKATEVSIINSSLWLGKAYCQLVQSMPGVTAEWMKTQLLIWLVQLWSKPCMVSCDNRVQDASLGLKWHNAEVK